jgi:carbamoyl-phosphate synthase large subunit
MKDKLLHIVGGGINQVPLVKLAKRNGLRVLVTDMYEDPPCRALADYYERIDTTQKEETLLAAERHKIDAVVTDQTDVAVPTVAYIAENLGLEGIGYETALKFTNKYLMRESLKDRLPDLIPEFHYLNDVQEALDFCGRVAQVSEYVVKPINSQGSKGVFRLGPNCPDQIKDSFLESRGRGVLLEKFVTGFEYSVESYVQDGKVYDLAITKKYHYASNDCIDERNTYLGDVSSEIESALFEANRRIIDSLALPFGITHAEFKMSNAGPVLMEIAARGGGGGISSKIIPFLTDFEPADALLHRIFKQPFPIEIKDYKERFAVMKFFNLKPGKIKNIYFDSALAKELLEFNIDVKSGDVIRPVKGSKDRPGYFVVAGLDKQKVLAMEEAVEASVQIEYE